MLQRCPCIMEGAEPPYPMSNTNKVHHPEQKSKRLDYPFNMSINVLFRAFASVAKSETSSTVTYACTFSDLR